jgi:hypothetical protein
MSAVPPAAATATTPEAGAARELPRGTRLLVAGGLLSALNGAAHFAMPLVYPPGGWAPLVEGLDEPMRWALYATTIFFGVLLVFGGALTVAVARAVDVPSRMVGWVASGMAAFWVIAAAYEVVVPFPIREAQWALPTFSLIVAGLYLTGGWLRLRSGS